MIVIADDITGAAEIAGIAFSKGQQVSLVCGEGIATDGTTVIATDTRSMTETEAVEETRRISSHFSLTHGGDGGDSPHLFKKTDSALRGHVVAELTALMQATGYERAVYLPANPSKGRTIREGIYYIDDVPIHQTAFSYDPEFPARTSKLSERFPDAESHHIMMPDARNKEDIRRVIEKYNDGNTIFAGAADLFDELTSLCSSPARPLDDCYPLAIDSDAWLDQKLVRLPEQERDARKGEGGEVSLILCGSTQSKALDLGITVAPMPIELYDGSCDISLWKTDAYANDHSLILTIPHQHRTGKETATHLRNLMARKAKELIAQHRPDHLVIEGGATAWTTLQALSWKNFTIIGQLTPGVVQMRADCGTLVTLKPGSYPWPDSFL